MYQCNSDWAHLADSEGYGHQSLEDQYLSVNFSDSQDAPYDKFMQGAHCMIYADDNEKFFDLYPKRAAVMMQMRFDGYLGFPGGLIDAGEDIVSGLNRELEEEIGLNLEVAKVSPDNHFASYVCKTKKLTLHFYILKVSLDTFCGIEKAVITAPDYGGETLGLMRVPCYVMPDNVRGLPVFLCQQFAGNARIELEDSLVKIGIFTKPEMDHIKNLSAEFRKKFMI